MDISDSAHIMCIDLALRDVRRETSRQVAKWGIQDHSQDKWLVILMEEVGEAARAICDKDDDNYEVELIQTAAVAVSALVNFKNQRAKRAYEASI
jgi:hypothetical protein